MNRTIPGAARALAPALLTLTLICLSISVSSAQHAAQSSAQAQTAAVGQSARGSQPNDKEYTDSIIKNTTEKYFLTELVDHLPLRTRCRRLTKCSATRSALQTS